MFYGWPCGVCVCVCLFLSLCMCIFVCWQTSSKIRIICFTIRWGIFKFLYPSPSLLQLFADTLDELSFSFRICIFYLNDKRKIYDLYKFLCVSLSNPASKWNIFNLFNGTFFHGFANTHSSSEEREREIERDWLLQQRSLYNFTKFNVILTWALRNAHCEFIFEAKRISSVVWICVSNIFGEDSDTPNEWERTISVAKDFI